MHYVRGRFEFSSQQAIHSSCTGSSRAEHTLRPSLALKSPFQHQVPLLVLLVVGLSSDFLL